MTDLLSKCVRNCFRHTFPIFFAWLTAPWASSCSFSLWLWGFLFLSFALGLSPHAHPGPTVAVQYLHRPGLTFATHGVSAATCQCAKENEKPTWARAHRALSIPVLLRCKKWCLCFCFLGCKSGHTRILNTRTAQWIVSLFRVRLAHETVAGFPILGVCLGLRPSK